MHHNAKALKKFHLYVNNQFFSDYYCVWDILVNYCLTDCQDFSESYFTETLLFFPFYDICCNFSSISFILGGLIFTWKKVLLKESVFFALILTITA